jgi:hypothetical protein
MTFACILMYFTYIYLKHVVVKYNCSKIKEGLQNNMQNHIKHCHRKYFKVQYIYENLLDGYFPFML